MLKQYLLVLVASGSIAITATFATAQNSSTPNDQSSPSAQNDGGRHHGPPDPAERTRELTEHLKLTSDQQTKVREALDSEHSQMESLHHDTSLSQPDRRSKMMEIRKSTDDQIRALLDSGQQQKWDKMQANREHWMQSHHGGPPNSGQQNPPPQQ